MRIGLDVIEPPVVSVARDQRHAVVYLDHKLLTAVVMMQNVRVHSSVFAPEAVVVKAVG